MDLDGRRGRVGRKAAAAALVIAGLGLVTTPPVAAGPPAPTVAEVTVTLVVVGEPPPDSLLAFFWACAADTDFTTFPATGGSQVFALAAGDECVFAVRDEPQVPSELFAADIATNTASPDITFTLEPAGVRFAASDTATGSPVATGTVTFTADFSPLPPPPPPSPPAVPVSAGPAFTG